MKSLRNANRRPTHPGAILREDVLPALGITQAKLAELLGVSRLTVSQILNEHRALTADMAMRLEKLLLTCGRPASGQSDSPELGACQSVPSVDLLLNWPAAELAASQEGSYAAEVPSARRRRARAIAPKAVSASAPRKDSRHWLELSTANQSASRLRSGISVRW